MNDIEKDIKRCEQLIKPEHANWIGISNQLAIAHIVDRVKEVENDLTTVYLKGYADAEEKYKKRIKELEEENAEIKNTKMNEYLHKNLWLAKYLNELYISKQKVKDKKKEIKKTGQYLYTNVDVCNILEELLEEK